jgi:hypothetical protein
VELVLTLTGMTAVFPIDTSLAEPAAGLVVRRTPA